jgi:hypothetical protein
MPHWGFDPSMGLPPDWPAAIEGYRHVCATQKQLLAVAGPAPRRRFYRSVRHGHQAP